MTWSEDVLAEAQSIVGLQSALMTISAATIDSAKAILLSSGLPPQRILQNFLFAAEYRCQSITSLVALCRTLDNFKEHLLERLARTWELNSEHLYFFYSCMQASIFSKEEATAVISQSENSPFITAFFGEASVSKSGQLSMDRDEFEEPIQLNDLPRLSSLFESGHLAVDSRVRQSVQFGCHLLRDHPTLAQYAAFWGALDCFRFLVDHGANLNFKDDKGRTVAQFAVAGGHPEIVSICQSKTDFSGVLTMASRCHRNDFFRSFPFSDTDALPLLHHCSVANNIELILHLVNSGGDVNQVDVVGNTALHMATGYNAIDAVWLLAKHPKALVNARNKKDGSTPLHVAASSGFVECIDLLLAHELVNQRIGDNQGRLPLHVAAENGHDEAIAALVATGTVTLNTRTDYGASVLHIALREGNLGLVGFLLEQEGIDVNAKTLSNETVLHCAARFGREGAIRTLVRRVEVNPKDDDGWTPLHYATQGKFQETVDLLLEVPTIQVNAVNNAGRTALHIAVQQENVELVQRFLDCPAVDVNQRDHGGWSPLHLAAKSGALVLVEMLLDVDGIEVNAGDKAGWTPLHNAVKYMHHGVTRKLLERPEIDVNVRAQGGWTPLHLACLNRDKEGEALLTAFPGVIVDAKDDEGRTPADLAQIAVFGRGGDDEDAGPIDLSVYFKD
jgi:cytohesin